MAEEEIGALLVRIEADMKDFESKMNASMAELDKMQKKTLSFSSALKNAFAFSGGLAIFDAIKKGFESSIKAGFDFNSTMQQNKIAFESMTGSAEVTEKLLGRLSDMAAETPFEFPELTTAAKKMMAFGFEAEKIPDMMTKIGDAAAGLGLGSAGVERITLALGQMQAKGKVSGEELLQLTESGVPALQILADAFGKTTTEISDMQAKGLIPAERAINALIEGMGERFPDMMAKQSQSFEGLMSTLKDNITVTFGQIVEPFFTKLSDDILPKIIERVDQFSETMGERGLGIAVRDLVLEFDKFLPVLTGTVSALAAYKTIGTITALIDAWKASTFAMTLAQQGLNAALLANPIGLVAAAIGGIVAVTTYAVTSYQKSIADMENSLIEGYKAERDAALEAVDDQYEGRIESLSETEKVESEAHYERLEKIQEEYNANVKAISGTQKALKKSLQERLFALDDAHDVTIKQIQEEYGVFEEKQKSKTDLVREAADEAKKLLDEQLDVEKASFDLAIENIRKEYGVFEEKQKSKIDLINEQYDSQKTAIDEILSLSKNAATEEGDTYKETYNAIIEKAREIHDEKIAMYQQEYLTAIGLINSQLSSTVAGYKSQIEALENQTKEEKRLAKEKSDADKIAKLKEAVANAKEIEDHVKARKALEDEVTRQQTEAAQERRAEQISELNDRISEAVKSAQTEKQEALKTLQEQVNERIPILEQQKNDEIKKATETRIALEYEETLKYEATKNRIADEKTEIDKKASAEISKIQEERIAKETAENLKYASAKKSLDDQLEALDNYKTSYTEKLADELKTKQDTENEKYLATVESIKKQQAVLKAALEEDKETIESAYSKAVEKVTSEAEKKLNGLDVGASDKTVVTDGDSISYDTNRAGTGAGRNSIDQSKIEKFTDENGGTYFKIPGFANGVEDFAGGLAMINEGRKGEIVNLPKGANVVPHDVSMEIARSLGSSLSDLKVAGTVQVVVNMEGKTVATGISPFMAANNGFRGEALGVS